MPVCPRCGKLISENKYDRHIQRHAIHHRKEPAKLYVPSATPSFEGLERGVLAGPDLGWTRRQRRTIQWALVIGFLSFFILFFLLQL